MSNAAPPYAVRRPARSDFVPVRGLRYHLALWGGAALGSAARPPLVMLHGWMDVGASFQFVVDALPEPRFVIAPDWRGFGLSDRPAADCYWFPDYLADLDALLDAVAPGQAVDLLGHSMGGNIAMIYAGVRPQRVRRLVNLEGFGLPESRPDQAPRRYAHWLDELREPQAMRRYASLEEVADRLRKTNPRLAPERAAWLAPHWSRRADDGHWEILADPAHKHANPVLYRKDEVLECWKCIQAPLLWVEGDRTDTERWWGKRYTKAEFHERLAVVPNVEKHLLADAGHMLHHDQPEALAKRLEAFLG
ncbi:MAG TPA: alpha/beta fold hydrolase [Burkholderiaceae bacterium]|nr:alpha/beta fold hydrolase [Burkholderiaceae bacterium]